MFVWEILSKYRIILHDIVKQSEVFKFQVYEKCINVHHFL